ncbi:MAG: PIG-L family deacetylase, partial [Planctomycetota bacterium]
MSSKLLALFILTLSSISYAHGDLPPSLTGPAALETALRKLPTTVSVLHIVAHPDDEDAGTITYLARGLGARTMLLSLTRGEGGANVISSDFFDALGALRTLETRKACDAYGVELFFTRAADYGYSKSVEEAQEKWDIDMLVRDTVRVIRRERPDIILSRFRGDRRDGHGHHTLSGIVSKLAYEAAADPKKYPEQIAEGLEPWEVKKLYTGNLRPQWRKDDEELISVSVDSGAYDPVFGASCYQIGRYGYAFHRSQGMSFSVGSPGPKLSHYRLVDHRIEDYSPGREGTILGGLTIGHSGLAEDAGFSLISDAFLQLDEKIKALDVDHKNPAASGEAIAECLGLARKIIYALHDSSEADSHEGERALRIVRETEGELVEVLRLALGLHFEAEARRVGVEGGRRSRRAPLRRVSPADSFEIRTRFFNRSHAPVSDGAPVVEVPDGWKQTLVSEPAGDKFYLQLNDSSEAVFRVEVAPTATS